MVLVLYCSYDVITVCCRRGHCATLSFFFSRKYPLHSDSRSQHVKKKSRGNLVGKIKVSLPEGK